MAALGCNPLVVVAIAGQGNAVDRLEHGALITGRVVACTEGMIATLSGFAGAVVMVHISVLPWSRTMARDAHARKTPYKGRSPPREMTAAQADSHAPDPMTKSRGSQASVGLR